MRLSVRSWGTGPRTALLVHGYSDDSSTWWRLGPALADRGWTVLAPDLRGHGQSPWASSYAIEDFADDLVETFPSGAELALGHSLGAVALGAAVARLRPQQAVFVDPPWLRDLPAGALAVALPSTPEELPSIWAPADVATDLRSNALVDPAVGRALGASLAAEQVLPPDSPGPGTAVLVPELDPALPVEAHAAVRRLGYEITTLPGVRHVMHRDDPEAFEELLLATLVTDPRVVHLR